VSDLGLFIIADARTLLAFRLAGLPGGAAADGAEARQLLAQGLADPGVGLILITEALAREMEREVNAARREGPPPLLLEIPDLKGPLPGGQPLLERLRSLMGIPK
jgi:V/A-type H+-transporting ATPase subunit F